MKYVAQIYIVVEGSNQANACDVISMALSEKLMASGDIVDWSYCRHEDGAYTQPQAAKGIDITPDETDLEYVWEVATNKAKPV